MSLFSKPKPQDMTLDEIERERRDTEETAKRQRRADDARLAREEAADAEAARRLAVRDALAALLGCSSSEPEPIIIAINARTSSRATVVPLWDSLRRVGAWTRPPVGTVDRAIAAALCLVAAGELAAPPKDSLFGAVAAKQVRQLPVPADAKPTLDEHLVRAIGLEVVRPPRDGVESYDETMRRTQEIELRGGYDATSAKRNREIAERARTLMDVKRAEARQRSRAAFAKEKAKQRDFIVAAIDGVLADLELGVAWWWARELRAHFAGESAAIADPQQVWHTCCALGLRFPFVKE